MVPKKTNLVLSIVLLIALLIPAVPAVVLKEDMLDMNKTISFADLGLTGQQDVQIWVGDELVEYGNTSGADVLYQPLNDYTTVIRPTLFTRWANHPEFMLTDAVDYLLAFALPIFVILGLGAILIGLAGYGRRR
jgi:hypothetical protein